MRKIGHLLLIGSVSALFLSGCGLSGSSTQLPQLDRNSLAAVYNKKQKDAAIKSMAKLAEEQKAEGDKVLDKQGAKPLGTATKTN